MVVASVFKKTLVIWAQHRPANCNQGAIFGMSPLIKKQWRGMLCPMSVSPKNTQAMRQRLRSYHYAETHMAQVEEAIAHIRDLEEGELLTGNLRGVILTGIVCTYARSFGQNDGLPKLPQKFEQFEEPDLQKSHEALIDARNYMYAHSDMPNSMAKLGDEDREKFRKIFVRVMPDGKKGWAVHHASILMTSMEAIVTLASFQRQRLRDESSKLFKSLTGGHEIAPGDYILNDELLPIVTKSDAFLDWYSHTAKNPQVG